MPGKGRKFKFFGAFKTKKQAIRRERATPGSFVLKTKVRGQRRYEVLKPK